MLPDFAPDNSSQLGGPFVPRVRQLPETIDPSLLAYSDNAPSAGVWMGYSDDEAFDFRPTAPTPVGVAR